MNPTLKAPGSWRLKLNCDEPLSNFAFKFKLRRYIMVWESDAAADLVGGLGDGWSDEGLARLLGGRGLHSVPFQLNLSSSVHRRSKINS